MDLFGFLVLVGLVFQQLHLFHLAQPSDTPAIGAKGDTTGSIKPSVGLVALVGCFLQRNQMNRCEQDKYRSWVKGPEEDKTNTAVPMAF